MASLRKIEGEIIEEEKVFWHILRRSFHSIIVIMIFWAIGSSFFISVEKMNFYDAIYHTSMIMTGLGPVKEILTNEAKVFSSIFAMISIGIVIAAIAYIFEPVFRHWHRRTYSEFHKKKK
jgi:ammonia channel protein AmtB